MQHDMTVPIDGGFINIRVGAIIMKDSRLLMVGNEHSDYLYSVGGRLKFGETAEQAVVREVLEETGVKMEIDRLGFVHENYFYADAGAMDGKLLYEISFFFYMKTPEDFEPVCKSFSEAGSPERLEWITLDCERTFYPEFFRTELASPHTFVRHFVTDERQQPQERS